MTKPAGIKSFSPRREKWSALASLGLLIVGSTGYLSLRGESRIYYVFAHVGALGVIGLLAYATGLLAKKKRRNFWRAFLLAAFFPIISGITAVLIFVLGEEGQLYCGGSVSLAVAFLIFVFYLLAKKKSDPNLLLQSQ